MQTMTFSGKTFEFGSQNDYDMAVQMRDVMQAQNRPSEFILAMLGGFGKTLEKAQKTMVLAEYDELTNQLRDNAEITAFVNAAIDQFVSRGQQLGVTFTGKLGNKLFVDMDAAKEDELYFAFTQARNLEGVDVYLSFHDNDEPAEGESSRFARIAIEAKDGIGLIEQATNKAASLAADLLSAELVEKGVKVIIGDDWYPVLRPASAAGGSKGGGGKLRFVKFEKGGKAYDGLKKDVALQLIADMGGVTEVKIGDKTAKLSDKYYSKWLDMLADIGALTNYQKYNKSAE